MAEKWDIKKFELKMKHSAPIRQLFEMILLYISLPAASIELASR